MQIKSFSVVADVITDNPKGVEPVLTKLVGKDAITKLERGFMIHAAMEGESSYELNKTLLSSLRRVTRRTTLRAEWTHDGVTERFFDYVPKGVTRKA